MKAVFLVKHGNPHESFEIREVPKPQPKAGEVLIKVEAFGLNFADVMARRGLYREAPPLPFVMGYDVCGIVEAVGSKEDEGLIGKRVAGMSRFGSYAEYCNTRRSGIIPIPDKMTSSEACALGTQYCTAWYAAFQTINMHEGERVLIHAGAGGVGTALIQLAKWRNCEIFSTAGSDEKIKTLKEAGVHHAINYRTEDYEQKIKEILKEDRLDISFNAIAGSTFKKDMRLLGAGGRCVLYGAAERAGKKGGKLATINLLRKMGLMIPLLRMAKSQSIVGVNMLKIADHRPERISEALTSLVELYEQGHILPKNGGVYPLAQLADAHEALESRKTKGKVVVTFDQES